MLKQNIPIKSLPKSTFSNLVSKSIIINEYFITALNSVNFVDPKLNLAFVCSQMTEMRAENCNIRDEIDVLKGKLISVENFRNTKHALSLVTLFFSRRT